MGNPATILVVDDHEVNRLLLHELIVSYGHRAVLVDNGLSALAHLHRDPPDLVLLDILMPELDGYDVLQRMRADGVLHKIPVLVVSSVDELDSIVRCIEAGAVDYITKPINRTLLKARLDACLEQKRLRDQEQRVAQMMEDYNLRLEAQVADQVRQITATELERASLGRYLSPTVVEAVLRAEKPLNLGGTQTRATVLFADIRGYTRLSQQIPPGRIMALLNEHFTAMSAIVFDNHGTLDKFIGDAVMAVFGWPFSTGRDEINALTTALQMQEAVRQANAGQDADHAISVGIGVNTGEVIAGNVGSPDKMDFTVLGDPVNIAARLQTIAEPGEVIVGEPTRSATESVYRYDAVGEVELKNLAHPIPCYRLLGPRDATA